MVFSIHYRTNGIALQSFTVLDDLSPSILPQYESLKQLKLPKTPKYAKPKPKYWIQEKPANFSYHRTNILNIVLVLPPAPADLVLLGLALAAFSARSAAAFRLMTVLGPPGGAGDAWRPVVEPVLGGVFRFESAPFDACDKMSQYWMKELAVTTI